MKNTAKRRLLFIVLMALGLFITNWSELFLQRNQDSIGWGISRPFLFVLINAHVIVIIILLSQIIRQSIKLFTERSRKQPGSAFTKNLFFAFALFSVIPSFFVFFSAGKFITTSIDDWFHARISSGLTSALTLHEAQTQPQRQLLSHTGKQIFHYMQSISGKVSATSNLYNSLLAHIPQQLEMDLYLWPVDNKRLNISIKQEILTWRTYRQLNDRSTKMLKQTFLTKFRDNIEHEQLFDFYGSLYWVYKHNDLFVVLIHRYPKEIRIPLIDIQNSLQDYSYLKSIRNPIYTNYIYTFSLLTLLILFLSIWCAFYLSKGLSKPIKNLIQATENLKQGKWNSIVPSHQNSDLKLLEQGFNEMIKALEYAHHELARKNKEILTILENIKAAVFFVNPWGRIITYNQAAKKLTGKYLNIDRFKNKRVNFLGAHVKETFFTLIKKLRRLDNPFLSEEISFTFQNEQKILMAHLTIINTNKTLNDTVKEGILIVIEDLTEVVKTNKIKTWREAAQQMAHEIKNPLTPIQLATQRLQRKYKNSIPDEQIFMDCTTTILQQVTIVKNLISHFSEFASMPKVQLELINLNTIIENTMRFYMISYPAISFIYTIEKEIPLFESDAKKLKRVLINLIDNSVRALLEQKASHKPKVFKITTTYDETTKAITLLISDNGPGIDKSLKDKLFLPYVSSHKKNMGLGLAIVYEILSHLNGTIELLPSAQGAIFKITLQVFK